MVSAVPVIAIFPIIAIILLDSRKSKDIRGSFGYFVVFYSLAHGMLLFPSLLEVTLNASSKSIGTLLQVYHTN